MNEAMKQAWLEITEMLGEPTREELDVFLRAWQRAIQAEREECARVCDDKHDAWRWDDEADSASGPRDCATAIRARGNT